jgi:hypothetical protein
MYMKLRLMKSSAALLPLFLLTVTSVQADTIFATGFEPPTYAVGPINGQDNWTGDGTIQTAVVKSGTQALQIDASGSGFFGASHLLSYAVGSKTVVFQGDFRNDGPGTSQAGISLDGNTGFLAQINGIGDRFHLGNFDQSSSSTQPFALGTWYHLEIVLNFQTETVTGYVDGQSLGSLAINPPAPTTEITNLVIGSFGAAGTQQDVYFDNVSLTGVPEPSSLVLAGWATIGMVASAVASRRKRVVGCE